MNKITAKTRSQIAREYGVSRRTLYNWLKKAKIEVGKSLLSPIQQKRIYEHFGHPSNEYVP